ncbi:MAG: periplasmic heavy metal sensor [Caldimicrobium sp.]
MRKKVLKGLAVAGLIGGLAFTAFAEAPQGQAPGYGPGYPMGPGYYRGPGMVGGPGMYFRWGYGTQVDSAKVKKFYEETKALRQKLWETREALRELYLSPNPDWKAIAEKRAEMAKLMTELQEKAEKAGIPFGYGRGMGFGMGLGMGFGYGKGFGPGACGCVW